MKKLLIPLCLVAFTSTAWPAVSNSAAPVKNLQPLDKIVAVVNKSVITNNELNKEVLLVEKNLQARHMQMPPENVLKHQVLQHMIDERLELEMANQIGIEVDSHDVDEAIKNIANHNHVSVAQIQKNMEDRGIHWKTYREQIKNQVKVQRLFQRAAGQIIITDEQVNDFIASNGGALSGQPSESFHLEDIVIPLPADPSSAVVQAGHEKAQRVLSQLHRGKNFNELAVAESSGDDALQGGDLGFRPLAELPEAFGHAVVKMKPGQLSEPIRTPNGWHIIRLVEIKNSGQRAAPNKEQVRNFLYQRQYNAAIESWLLRIKSSAYVKTYI